MTVPSFLCNKHFNEWLNDNDKELNRQFHCFAVVNVEFSYE